MAGEGKSKIKRIMSKFKVSLATPLLRGQSPKRGQRLIVGRRRIRVAS